MRDINPISSLKKSESETHEVRIYPNPVSEVLILETSSDQVHQLEIHTISGQLLESIELKNSTSIDVNHLSAGVYIINIDGLATEKFIKQ